MLTASDYNSRFLVAIASRRLARYRPQYPVDVQLVF